MKGVKTTLDDSVHGHEKAKKQIARIIGQWINGEQDGHCFGFEGPPGVGKTSLAKYGLAKCLTDGDGNSRPFAMIQMGGDCQGSTLVGHNYTYVG
jgi:ATP-dependent Lon protease